MSVQMIVTGLGVLLSIIYVVYRLRKEWKGHSAGCGHCPLKKLG